MKTDSFAYRHIGPREEDVQEMLSTIGANSIDELIDIEGMDEERAGKLIMTARAPWFE